MKNLKKESVIEYSRFTFTILLLHRDCIVVICSFYFIQILVLV